MGVTSYREWKNFLPVASILNSCFLLTQAPTVDICITLDPPNPVAGRSVTLWPEGTAENVLFCRWYRGNSTEPKAWIFEYQPDYFTQVIGDAYTQRETGGLDCSMHIRNLRVGDTGNYTVIKGKVGEAEKGQVFLEVLAPDYEKQEKNVRGLSAGATLGIAAGSLLGVLLIIGLICNWHFTISLKKMGQYSKKHGHQATGSML